MNRTTIPEDFVSELADEDIDQLMSDAGAPPVDAEPAAGLGDTGPAQADAFADLPNRPLQQDEVIYQRGNISVINRAAPSQYIRLYDRDGRPRIVLRELAAFALSIVDGTGARAYQTRPPVTPKPNDYRCRAPGCRKALATQSDRETHERAYHQAYAAEQEAKKKRKAEIEAKRQADLLNAALIAILKKESGEPLLPGAEPIEDRDELRPPSAEMTRSELLGVLSKAFKERRHELFKMSKDQLLELYAEAYRMLSEDLPVDEEDEGGES